MLWYRPYDTAAGYPQSDRTQFPLPCNAGNLIGYAYSKPLFLLSKSIGCPEVWNPQFGPIKTLSPNEIIPLKALLYLTVLL